ncbi:hypothetical protein HYV70_04000 [Candidatus Uhrbacteria bacterium]|nr:hypothetical protein [Candidatus Uhrbacteria bacterium]
MKKMLFWLLFLFATIGFSSAKIVMAQENCVRIDLSDTTAVIEKNHDVTWKYGINTKPYIPWTVEDGTGEGKGCVNFGDLRLFEQAGKRVFLYIQVDGINIILLSGMNEGILVRYRSEESKRKGGFSLFEPKATEFVLKGLEPGSAIVLGILVVKKGRFESAAPMGLTHCIGQFNDIITTVTNYPTCPGTDLQLEVLEWRRYRPFGGGSLPKKEKGEIREMTDEDARDLQFLFSPVQK